jgi:hypothetical protein
MRNDGEWAETPRTEPGVGALVRFPRFAGFAWTVPFAPPAAAAESGKMKIEMGS